MQATVDLYETNKIRDCSDKYTLEDAKIIVVLNLCIFQILNQKTCQPAAGFHYWDTRFIFLSWPANKQTNCKKDRSDQINQHVLPQGRNQFLGFLSMV